MCINFNSAEMEDGMRKPNITRYLTKQFLEYLEWEEKSKRTLKRYRRGMEKLLEFARGKNLDKKLMIAYKEKLWADGYRAKTVNVFLAAANSYLKYMGWEKFRVKTCRIQRKVFRDDERDLSRQEYRKLLAAALEKKKYRLYYMMKTMYVTGARVSELGFVTVQTVQNGGAEIRCKGKTRMLFIPSALRRELLAYIQKQGIEKGIVFRTRGGKSVDRSNFWKEMKKLGEYLNQKGQEIKKSRIYPHNLRHLFAQNVYGISKDIVKVSHLLGHSSVETTKIYVQTGYGEYRKLVEETERMC